MVFFMIWNIDHLRDSSPEMNSSDCILIYCIIIPHLAGPPEPRGKGPSERLSAFDILYSNILCISNSEVPI